MRSMVEGQPRARWFGAWRDRPHPHPAPPLLADREFDSCNSPSEYLDSREAIAAYIDAALEDATQPSSSIRSVSWLARSA